MIPVVLITSNSNGIFISTIHNHRYLLAQNNDKNHLHGGVKGFDKVVLDIKNIISDKNAIGIELEYISQNNEEGYPGTLTTNIKCYINNNNELVFDYTATTDKTTVINLTHHGYFNLNGIKGDIKEHLIEINADKITTINGNLIPNGDFTDVLNTPFDFRKPMKIGQKIDEAGGYDHNYVLYKSYSELSFAAKVTEENSGRVMEVYTTEPGMQFYSSNFLDGTLNGKNNITYHKHYALCLETQHFPDSPNHTHFPSTILEPGEKYLQKTMPLKTCDTIKYHNFGQTCDM